MTRPDSRGPLARLLVVTLWLSLVAIPAADAGVPLCAGIPATHVGTAGDDVLTGTADADVFVGRAGNDRLIGRGGDDTFCTGPDDDVAKGGGGSDQIRGQGGNDTLTGGPGDDTLLGGGGDDSLNGGGGTDVTNGGSGTDECLATETVLNCETPSAGFEVDGSWSGLTSQDKDISFEVADHALTTITIVYGWTGSGCTSESETTIQFATPLEIVGNVFDIDSNPGTLSLQIHGEFTSDTAATGAFSATDNGGFCPGSALGTWDAGKA